MHFRVAAISVVVSIFGFQFVGAAKAEPVRVSPDSSRPIVIVPSQGPVEELDQAPDSRPSDRVSEPRGPRPKLAPVKPRQVTTHFFALGGKGRASQTVIGASQVHSVKSGETFVSIARDYGVGYNELVGANPNVDPWKPQTGKQLVVPTEWILPRGHYEGVVINIPEMRLYFYLPSPRKGVQSKMVVTFPIGLGRREWQNPINDFFVRGKTKNPPWVIPEPIRQERFAKYGSMESILPGGHPENPLGRLRLDLTLPEYAIHGTNQQWGIGMQLVRGSIALYPEDMAALFPLVPVGTPGKFVYQPVKIGIRNGRSVVEVHPDVYSVSPWTWRLAKDLVKEVGVSTQTDWKKLESAVGLQNGVPIDFSNVELPEPDLKPQITFDEKGNPIVPY